MKTHVDPGRSNFGASRTHINNRLSFNFSHAILTRRATSHCHSLPACLLPAMQAQQTDSSKQALPSLPSPARLAHHHRRHHRADVAAVLSGLPSLPPLPEERAVTRIRRDGHPVRRDSRSPKLDLENYQRRALILAPRYLDPGTYRGNPRLPGFDEADELPSTTSAAVTMLSPAESTLNLREMEQDEITRANSSARRSTHSQTRRQSRADSSADSKDFAEMPKESSDVPAGLSVRKVNNSIKKQPTIPEKRLIHHSRSKPLEPLRHAHCSHTRTSPPSTHLLPPPQHAPLSLHAPPAKRTTATPSQRSNPAPLLLHHSAAQPNRSTSWKPAALSPHQPANSPTSASPATTLPPPPQPSTAQTPKTKRASASPLHRLETPLRPRTKTRNNSSPTSTKPSPSAHRFTTSPRTPLNSGNLPLSALLVLRKLGKRVSDGFAVSAMRRRLWRVRCARDVSIDCVECEKIWSSVLTLGL